jgi:NTP pyrophosphatase (non-canonical NTP hydrolase)
MTKDKIISLVLAERESQDKLWGDQSQHDHFVFNAILGEEVGEVSRALLERKFNRENDHHIEDELIQVIAVAVAWLEFKF